MDSSFNFTGLSPYLDFLEQDNPVDISTDFDCFFSDFCWEIEHLNRQTNNDPILEDPPQLANESILHLSSNQEQQSNNDPILEDPPQLANE